MLDEDKMEYIRSARRDTDRLIMGVIFTSLIGALWVIVLGFGIENRLIDGVLGATVSAFILMVQFYFRSSGSKK
jgi:hypothetical protein